MKFIKSLIKKPIHWLVRRFNSVEKTKEIEGQVVDVVSDAIEKEIEKQTKTNGS